MGLFSSSTTTKPWRPVSKIAQRDLFPKIETLLRNAPMSYFPGDTVAGFSEDQIRAMNEAGGAFGTAGGVNENLLGQMALANPALLGALGGFANNLGGFDQSLGGFEGPLSGFQNSLDQFQPGEVGDLFGGATNEGIDPANLSRYIDNDVIQGMIDQASRPIMQNLERGTMLNDAEFAGADAGNTRRFVNEAIMQRSAGDQMADINSRITSDAYRTALGLEQGRLDQNTGNQQQAALTGQGQRIQNDLTGQGQLLQAMMAGQGDELSAMTADQQAQLQAALEGNRGQMLGAGGLMDIARLANQSGTVGASGQWGNIGNLLNIGNMQQAQDQNEISGEMARYDFNQNAPWMQVGMANEALAPWLQFSKTTSSPSTAGALMGIGTTLAGGAMMGGMGGGGMGGFLGGLFGGGAGGTGMGMPQAGLDMGFGQPMFNSGGFNTQLMNQLMMGG